MRTDVARTAVERPRGSVSRWDVMLPSRSEPSDAVFDWLVGLRWMAIAGVALVLSVAGPALRVLPTRSAPMLWGILAALAGYNAALATLGPTRGPTWVTHVAAQIVIDCVALAALVHFSGGIENPFISLFVLHVVSANIVLQPRAASGLLLLAIALAAGMVLGEGTGWLGHYCLHADPAACRGDALTPWTMSALAGLSLTLGSSSYLARYLTARLYDSEDRLADTIAALSVEKERLAESQGAIALERSRLQAIINCMGDAVTFSDPDGQILVSNERARELRRSAAPTDGVDPTSDALRRAFAAMANGREPLTQPAFTRSGRTHEATCAVVRDRGDRLLGLVTVTRDITDRVALERHLMDEERMAVVGKLAAAVAHEINNPMGVVSLYAQHALAKLPPESPIAKHLETILRNAESGRRIIGELLELARPRTPKRASVDLRQLCQDVTQSVRPLADEAGVRVVDESRAHAGPLWAEGDVDQLRQAVLNLALNAVEASREGDRVALRAYEMQDRGTTMRVIEVSDTGPGIAPDDLAQIFTPFFTTKPTGTGLGLAVADTIVKAHHGRMTVDSSAERGTAFRILLPGTGVPTTAAGA